jgi:hypothetical protein
VSLKLKNCYRCESDSVEVLLARIETTQNKTSIWFAVYCHDCELDGPEAKTEQTAIDKWNSRNF